jgi:hypothetical protein
MRRAGNTNTEGAMKIHAAFLLAVLGLALVPASAKADAQQDQQPCMNDAMTICGQFIPDRERVASCLISNRTRVSVAGRAALRHFVPQRPVVRRTAFVR